jgi:2,3-bisphosphoglycerate-dependent phosphoglycerate mutase
MIATCRKRASPRRGAAGRRLRAQGLKFDVAFTSDLKRAQRTLSLILEERDYGDLVGLDKDDARKKWGDERVHQWRCSYDIAPPNGERLRDTAARVLPYYITEMLPRVMRGERVLCAAHGNSLRALVMVLDRHTTRSILDLNLGAGVPMVYHFKSDTPIASKLEMAA